MLMITAIVIGLTGIIIWLIILLSLIAEIRRATRQSCRLCRVYARLGKRPLTRKEKLKVWKSEIFASYNSLRIGIYEIPYDPDQKIRRGF